MQRFILSVAAVLLVAGPIVGLGAIGASFLATPNERRPEFDPVSLAELKLDAAGAVPKQVVLTASRRDAWMRGPVEPAAPVYVRRVPETNEIVVLSAVGRLGARIEFEPELGCYQSTCFVERFDLNGRWFFDRRHSFGPTDDMMRVECRVVGDLLHIPAPFVRKE